MIYFFKLVCLPDVKKKKMTKGTRWMPWHWKPTKDAASCEKPRGAAHGAWIRGSPNGENPAGIIARARSPNT